MEGELGAAPGWILGGEESSEERTTPKNEGEAAEVFDSGTLASSRGGSGDDARGKGKNAPLGGPKTLGRDVRGFAYVVEEEKTNNPSSSRRGGGGKGGRIVGALFAEPLSRARWTVAPGLGGGGSDDDAGCVRVASGDNSTTADGSSGWARTPIVARGVDAPGASKVGCGEDASGGRASGDGRGRVRVRPGRVRVLACLLYTSPSPRDQRGSRMPSSA